VYLPDGTPYRATVSAIYARSLAAGDVLIPAAVTAGHTGTAAGVATVERRRVLRLLGRVGATRGQVAAVFGWQAVFVIGTGLIAGVAAGAVTMLTVTRAVTGSWVPFIPLVPAAGLVAVVAALTVGAIMIPFHAMARREPTLTR
jgi:putative ABC transport system permease protein